MLDYEKLAQEAKPFEGLTSREEVDKLMVYFMYVREPVMSPEEILHKWCFCLDHDIPVFEAAQIADQVRYEMRCQRERPKRILNKLLSCVCVLLLVLVAVEIIRVPRRNYLDECGRVAANAKRDARQKIATRISDLVCAAQSGMVEIPTALGEIKDLINEEPIRVLPVDVDLSKLMSIANQIESQSNASVDTAFDCAEHLKDYLVKNTELDEVLRLDLMDMMINCYNKALDGGYGKAGYELFLLYNGLNYCARRRGHLIIKEISLTNKLVVADNLKLAKRAFCRSCELGNYAALSIVPLLSLETFREMELGYDECHKYLLSLGQHIYVTSDQLWDVGCCLWEIAGKELTDIQMKEVVDHFRKASARGHVKSKKWLLKNGYSFQ